MRRLGDGAPRTGARVVQHQVVLPIGEQAAVVLVVDYQLAAIQFAPFDLTGAIVG